MLNKVTFDSVDPFMWSAVFYLSYQDRSISNRKSAWLDVMIPVFNAVKPSVPKKGQWQTV